MMVAKTDAVPAEGAAAKKRAWVRKPKAEGGGGAEHEAPKQRRRKPAEPQAPVFGARAGLFDLIQQRAEIAKALKSHLEAMRDEFGKLAPDVQDAGARLIASMAQSGIDALQGLELGSKPEPAKHGRM